MKPDISFSMKFRVRELHLLKSLAPQTSDPQGYERIDCTLTGTKDCRESRLYIYSDSKLS
jgi:hypothetical protein